MIEVCGTNRSEGPFRPRTITVSIWLGVCRCLSTEGNQADAVASQTQQLTNRMRRFLARRFLRLSPFRKSDPGRYDHNDEDGARKGRTIPYYERRKQIKKQFASSICQRALPPQLPDRHGEISVVQVSHPLYRRRRGYLHRHCLYLPYVWCTEQFFEYCWLVFQFISIIWKDLFLMQH